MFDTYGQKRLLPLVALLILLTTVLCACDMMPPSLTLNAPKKTLATMIDDFLTRQVDAQQFSGVVLVRYHGQVILRKAYGLADVAHKLSVTLQTRFGIGSLTKAFTAMAVLQLQEQGKLWLHDKICTYIPSCPSDWRDITIRELLTHTSGIPDEPATYKRTLAYLETVPLAFQPGSRFSYSNSGYVVLGTIIERASGEAYAAFLRQHIFEPLQLTHSGYDYTNPSIPGIAVGYQTWGMPATYTRIGYHFSSGALYSTLDDMARWDEALWSGNQSLVSSQDLQEMFTPQAAVCSATSRSCSSEVSDVSQESYGYGWFLGERFGHRIIYHTGDTNGFTAYHAFYPDDQLMIIVLSNLVAATTVRTQMDQIVFDYH